MCIRDRFYWLDSHLLNIISKCINKERSAQNELHKQFYSYGLGICMRYVKDPLEARSVLNQSFYKVFKNIDKYNTRLDFKPWFKTIIVNTSLDYLRVNQKFTRHDSIEDNVNITIDSPAISDLSYKDMLKLSLIHISEPTRPY